MKDLLIAIARNAFDLLSDAELLFEQGRFPRAASLAVLAGEEAGKFWLVKFEQGDWTKKFRSHYDKLAVSAPFQLAEAEGLEITSTGGLCETYRDAPNSPEYGQFLQRAQAFDPIKQAGLYVDIADVGVLEPSIAVTEEDAVKCLSFARGEVKRLYAARIVQRHLPPLAD